MKRNFGADDPTVYAQNATSLLVDTSNIANQQTAEGTKPILSSSDIHELESQVVLQLQANGVIKDTTTYLIIGDEPDGFYQAVNLAVSMTPEQYLNLKSALTVIPRQILKAWFDIHIKPSIEGRYYNMMWGAFLDAFNIANLEKIKSLGLDAWGWEEKKLEAYYVAQNTDTKAKLDIQFSKYIEDEVLLAPEAMALMRAYKELPPLGDIGLEINRQNAVKELLKKRDYSTVKAIIDAYRYSQYTVLGPLLTKPIANDINTPDVKVKATSVQQ